MTHLLLVLRRALVVWQLFRRLFLTTADSVLFVSHKIVEERERRFAATARVYVFIFVARGVHAV